MTHSFHRHVLIPICLAAALGAQVNKGNLTGIVRDTSGAAVPGIPLTLVHAGTGASRQAVSDPTGLYRFTLLDHGFYRLEVEAAGFKKLTRENIELQTGETTTVDLELELGGVVESVTITAESPLLRTETASLGSTIEAKSVTELPLLGRNPYIFTMLSPGMLTFGNPLFVNPWDNGSPLNFVSSGSTSRSEFLLDGVPNMSGETVGLNPSPDSVHEMRLQTNAYDAEYGHSGAAFVNVSTKSGTNQLRGSVFWYHRNDNLNANGFFANRVGRAKQDTRRNVMGTSFTGPVVLPKLYDGKNRTHFSFTYEGIRWGETRASRFNIPSLVERTGDFSATTDRTARPFTIYDPATTRILPTGTASRAAFPGNRIPQSRMDPVAVKSLAFYPRPNRVPTPEAFTNFEASEPFLLHWNNVIGRLDHRFGDNHTLFFRYGWGRRYQDLGTPYGPEYAAMGHPRNQEIAERDNTAAAVGHTWVLSPNTVADFRLGLTRNHTGNGSRAFGFDISRLGLPDSFVKSSPALFPRFTIADTSGLGPDRTVNHSYTAVYNPLVNLHTSLRRHAVKYGFRYQAARETNRGNIGRATGEFNFTRVSTRGPDPTRQDANRGHGFASFLLGAAADGFADATTQLARQYTYSAVYLQDDWKTTDRLSLNLGLRLEHEGATTERYNRGNAGFEFSAASPIEAAARANYARQPVPELPTLDVRGGLRFLDLDGYPRGHLTVPAVLWAPRFGYAYRLTNRVVWRGGWGMFYAPNNDAGYRQEGFSLRTLMITSLDDNLTTFHTLANPFPNGVSPAPGARDGLLTALGKNITTGGITTPGEAPFFRHGLSQQFSTGFQMLLPARLSLDASYVGNLSQRLTVSRNVNLYADSYLPLKARLNQSVPNPFSGVITDRTSLLSQRTIPLSQLLSPYPHFLGVTQSSLPYGRTWYNSMQLQLSRRLANGLQFGAAYTLSKLFEATSYLNDNDAALERVISENDRPQRLVLHGHYELPFGKGKPLLNSTNGLARRLAGGWQVSWITVFQAGQALSFPGAERLFGSKSNPGSIDEYFDRAQFIQREPFTRKVLSTFVADLRGPGINKWDLTLRKSVPIREGLRLILQGEFYNAFNTTQLGNPNTSINTVNFGQITATQLGPREIMVSARVSF